MKEFDAYKVSACLDVLIKGAQAGQHLPNVVAAARGELLELDAALRPVPPSAIPAPVPEPELDLGTDATTEPRRL